MVEVHPKPATALSDGPQSLNLESFTALLDDIRGIAQILGRDL
jgi:3-deoxy-7-phosphoheptulonate synthase